MAEYSLDLTGILADEHLDAHDPNYGDSNGDRDLEARANDGPLELSADGGDGAVHLLGSAAFEAVLTEVVLDALVDGSGTVTRAGIYLRFGGGGDFYVAEVRADGSVAFVRAVAFVPDGASTSSAGAATTGERIQYKFQAETTDASTVTLRCYEGEDLIHSWADTHANRVTATGRSGLTGAVASGQSLANVSIYGHTARDFLTGPSEGTFAATLEPLEAALIGQSAGPVTGIQRLPRPCPL